MEVPKSWHLFSHFHQLSSLFLFVVVLNKCHAAYEVFLVASCIIILYIEAHILEYVLKISNAI